MIAGVLLAAGDSRRFRSRKLLHPLADGTPIGVRSAENLVAAVDRAFAVLAPDDRELSALLAPTGVIICPCQRSREGMGASLACGVRASPDADGWIIALADMPFLMPSTIAAVAQALRDGAPLAAPACGGQRGHPVGFTRRYHAELEQLTGDAGARDIVKRESQELRLLSIEDPGMHRDIDTPEDLRRLLGG